MHVGWLVRLRAPAGWPSRHRRRVAVAPLSRHRRTRLIAIHRWLGAAHHVEKQPLYGENLDHDCIKAFERGGTTVSPSNGRCWGDPGNGVQIGWFVWAEALLRRKLNLT